MKEHIKRAVGRQVLPVREYRTFIAEVAAIVNNRPLLYLSNEDQLEEILTPSRLLRGYDIDLYNSETEIMWDAEDTPDSSMKTLIQHHEMSSAAIAHFKRLWEESYLQSLRERARDKLKTSPVTPVVGEIVALKEEGKAHTSLVKVVELVRGIDGNIREVKVKKLNKELRVPVNRLIPLYFNELCNDNDSEISDIHEQSDIRDDSENNDGPSVDENTNLTADRISWRTAQVATSHCRQLMAEGLV